MKKIIIFLGVFFLSFLLISCKNKEKDPTLYTVSFEVGGSLSIASQEVEAGKLAKSPANPTRDGYTFLYWQLNGAKFEFTTPITSSITLVAKWQENDVFTKTFIVSFEVDGGSVVGSQTISQGNKVLKPVNPTRQGYTFVYWQLNGIEYDFTTNVTANMRLVAKWEVIPQYTITFNVNGGSSIDSITDYKDQVIEKPSDPEKDRYVFLGWFFDSNLKQAVTWPITLSQDITLYAAWNSEINLKALLNDLIANYRFDVMSHLPEKLRPGANLYTNNLVTDFSDFVDLSELSYSGFGEQWQMVLDNLVQAQNVLSILNTTESAITAGVSAFNNYIDSNPDSANEFVNQMGIYNVFINYDNEKLTYVLDFETTGGLLAQIALTSIVGTNEKTVRVQIGDNSVKYSIKDNGYSIASKYGGKIYGYEGIRTSFISFHKDENNYLQGNIFEELTVERPLDDKGNPQKPLQTTSAAQFYTNVKYLFTVGNKASGMIGFNSTIIESYDINSGKFLGYEIQESLSALTYNTLWFNLDYQTGINNIKLLDKKIYINNQTTVFKTKNWGDIHGKTASRRYDIEFRKQYVYISVDGNIESFELLMPMLFIQAEKFDELTTDVVSNNSYINSFSLNVSPFKNDLEKAYETSIEIFKKNKDFYTYQMTIDFIGDRILFN